MPVSSSSINLESHELHFCHYMVTMATRCLCWSNVKVSLYQHDTLTSNVLILMKQQHYYFGKFFSGPVCMRNSNTIWQTWCALAAELESYLGSQQILSPVGIILSNLNLLLLILVFKFIHNSIWSSYTFSNDITWNHRQWPKLHILSSLQITYSRIMHSFWQCVHSSFTTFGKCWIHGLKGYKPIFHINFTPSCCFGDFRQSTKRCQVLRHTHNTHTC